MFRIRRVYDNTIPIDQETVRQVQGILREQFSGVSEEDVVSLPDRLRNPLKYRFQSILLVADDLKGQVRFCYLTYMATANRLTGSGVGGALYQQVRERARLLRSVGLFYECLPDDPLQCKDEQVLKQNRARLRFYERYGARPIISTAYETPLKEGEKGAPYLVYDDLGGKTLPRLRLIRPIVRAILERQYGSFCPPGYIDKVVQSFRDDPIRLRDFRYIKEGPPSLQEKFPPSIHASMALIVTDRHEIHQVRDRGYVEAPVRIKSILMALERSALFRRLKPHHFPDGPIKAVHDGAFVDYLRKCCFSVKPGTSVYPYVFPIRNSARPPRELTVRAGYYCIDTFTPLNRNAYVAARRAVDCALTGVKALLEGERLVYVLVRPPGHHAERAAFGGFCYFNSAAIAANELSKSGKVAVLDVDYHHGNGTQSIFYERSDVLTLSIHGHPRFAYPYFSGFEEETGEGNGTGYNVNYPLPEHVDGERYRQTFAKALRRIVAFKPKFLVVTLGLDTARGDPTGTWSLSAKDFERNGQMIGGLYLPILVVQEGGYRTRSLGVNARSFFTGLLSGAQRIELPNWTFPGKGEHPHAVPAVDRNGDKG